MNNKIKRKILKTGNNATYPVPIREILDVSRYITKLPLNDIFYY